MNSNTIILLIEEHLSQNMVVTVRTYKSFDEARQDTWQIEEKYFDLMGKIRNNYFAQIEDKPPKLTHPIHVYALDVNEFGRFGRKETQYGFSALHGYVRTVDALVDIVLREEKYIEETIRDSMKNPIKVEPLIYTAEEWNQNESVVGNWLSFPLELFYFLFVWPSNPASEPTNRTFPSLGDLKSLIKGISITKTHRGLTTEERQEFERLFNAAYNTQSVQ